MEMLEIRMVAVKYNTRNGDIISADDEPKYTGNGVLVEVTEEIAELLYAPKRQKANEERNKRRRYQTSGYFEVSIDELSKRLNSSGEQWEGDPPDYNSDICLDFERREQITAVRKAVASLGAEKQQLVQAIEYNGVPVKLYAEQKGLSFQAVYKQRNKIRKELKNILAP